MSGPTILVADDDASVRLVISQTLAQEGYHVRATNTMSALWRWIQAGEGDLLITDVYMPDESIFDMLPQIRRTRPDLPIIVISAQSTVLTAAMASDHGAYDYLPKPFEPKELVLRIQSILKRARSATRPPAPAKILRFGSFLFEIDRRRLFKGETPVYLTEAEGDLHRAGPGTHPQCRDT